RISRERQRAQPRDAAGRDEAPRQISAAHRRRVGLRRQFRQADEGAAARRHQPHVPRRDLTGRPEGAESLVGSRYEFFSNPDAKPPQKDYFAIYDDDAEEAPSGEDLVGYVHSWEAGTTVDGPGIRFVGFLTGCVLRCPYCHNPDTWHRGNGPPVRV